MIIHRNAALPLEKGALLTWNQPQLHGWKIVYEDWFTVDFSWLSLKKYSEHLYLRIKKEFLKSTIWGSGMQYNPIKSAFLTGHYMLNKINLMVLDRCTFCNLQLIVPWLAFNSPIFLFELYFATNRHLNTQNGEQRFTWVHDKIRIWEGVEMLPNVPFILLY